MPAAAAVVEAIGAVLDDDEDPLGEREREREREGDRETSIYRHI